MLSDINKIYIQSAVGFLLVVVFIAGAFVYHKKPVEVSPVITTTTENNATSTLATSTRIVTSSLCDTYSVHVTSSSTYNLPSLRAECEKNQDSVFVFRHWIFGDTEHKKDFGVLYEEIGSKCDCGGFISYFDYDKVYKDGETFRLKKSEVVDYKTIYNGSSSSAALDLHAFDGFPYLLNFMDSTFYFIEPNSKEVYEGLQIGENQTFCSSEMGCAPNISVSITSQIVSVDVFTYATGTELFVGEPTVTQKTIRAPH